MRLERMNIQGFGAVRDKSLEIDAPVTVLYGPNEAGKSASCILSEPCCTDSWQGSPAERGEPSEEGIHGGERGFWIRRSALGGSALQPVQRREFSHRQASAYIFIN